ncbi:hypothetical protein IAT40_007877 [Kwoniella sp. CBS 6097]
MSRTTIANLEAQLSSTTHELELATFLNKGILQTNTEYKLRIAELESENVILQKAESRLSQTEDKLEEVENKLRAILAEKGDWQVERERDLEEKDMLIRERDEWKESYWALRQRLDDVLSGEQAQKTGSGSGSVLKMGSGSNQRQLASLVNPDHRASARGSGNANLSSRGADVRTPTAAAKPRPVASSSKRQCSSRQITQPQTQPAASSSKISLSSIRQPMRAQSKKRRRVQDSSSGGEDNIDSNLEAEKEEVDAIENVTTGDGRSRSLLFHRRARDQKIILDGADDHLDFDSDDDVDGDGRMQSDPLGGSQLYNQSPPKNYTPSRNRDRDRDFPLKSNPVASTAGKINRISTTSTMIPSNHQKMSSNNRQHKKSDATATAVHDIDVKAEPISISPDDRNTAGARGAHIRAPKKGQAQRIRGINNGNGARTLVRGLANSSGSESEDDPLAMV